MSNTEGTSVLVQGRIVWLSGRTPFEGREKVDQHTRQPRRNAKGETMIEYGFGLSVPHDQLNPGGVGAELWAAIHAETYKLYPSRQLPPGYAWKYKDGNGVDHNGQPFGAREGYQNCLVFAMTTSLPIKFYKWENGANVLVNDGIKCGDYIQVQVQVKAHPPAGQGKAGLYLNPGSVRLIGYGTEIINAPSADQVFGASAPAVPQGASAVPLAPQGAMPSAAPMPGAPSFAPPQQQAPAQPHYQVLPPAHQPPPGGVPQMGNGYPPQAPGPQPQTYPAPAAPAIPSGFPTAPSFATPAAPTYPQQQQPQYPTQAQHQPMPQPGYPPQAPGFPQYPQGAR